MIIGKPSHDLRAPNEFAKCHAQNTCWRLCRSVRDLTFLRYLSELALAVGVKADAAVAVPCALHEWRCSPGGLRCCVWFRCWWEVAQNGGKRCWEVLPKSHLWYWHPQPCQTTFNHSLSDNALSQEVWTQPSAPGSSGHFGDRGCQETFGTVWGCEVLGPVLFTKWGEIKHLSSLYSLDVSLDFCQLSS